MSLLSLNKIIIINLPSKGNVYTLKSDIEYFKITPEGLIFYTPPKISIPQEILIGILGDIKFNTDTYKLIVFSSQVIANPTLHNTAYFLFKLRDPLHNIKYHSLYKADENMDSFSSFLNQKSFEINDIIEIDCISQQSIILKNFPTIGENENVDSSLFNLQGVKKFLKITKNGLKNYIPNNILPIDTLQNTIKINDSTNTPVITLEFNTLDKVLRTFKFKNIVSDSMDYDYFTFKLFDSSNSLICNSTLRTNTDVEAFLDEINFKIFDYSYVIELTYDDRSKSFINITNFPNKNDTHIPILNVERYLLTLNGFETI